MVFLLSHAVVIKKAKQSQAHFRCRLFFVVINKIPGRHCEMALVCKLVFFGGAQFEAFYNCFDLALLRNRHSLVIFLEEGSLQFFPRYGSNKKRGGPKYWSASRCLCYVKLYLAVA